MITLIPQLESELQNLFNTRTDSYKNTIVKEIYKSIPKGHYPKVIIQEINNTEVISRTSNEGIRTISLGYQITTYSRSTKEHDSVDASKFIADIIDDYIQNNYQFQRTSGYQPIPYIVDPTIMTCNLRYNCVYDKETRLIYKN